MKKMVLILKQKIVIVSLSMIAIVCIGACALIHDNIGAVFNNKTCTIYFDTNGGTNIQSQEIKCGSLIAKPKDPIKDGFEFDNWFYDDKPFDFTSKVNNNIVIKALWKELENVEYIEIAFDSKGGTPIDKIKIIKGGKISAPLVPTKKDYKFIGWYLNDIKFNFNNNITENILLIAKWEKDNSNRTNGDTSKVLRKEEKVTNNTQTETYKNESNQKYDNDSNEKNIKNTINVSTSNINLYVGTSENFSISYTPQDADWLTVGCYKNDENIAHIQGNGNNIYKVSGVGVGSTTITCYNENGGLAYGVYKKINVNVRVAPVTGIDTTIVSNVEVGQQIQIHSNVVPSYAGNQGISYSSSNSSIASIDSNGVITGRSVGTVSITVRTDEGNFSKTFNVNVIEPRVVQEVRIPSWECPMSAHVGDTYHLSASVSPTGTSTITWKSLRPAVATVDQNGNITLIGTGTAIIHAIADADSNIKGICTIGVHE